jgi:hypothetical protein
VDAITTAFRLVLLFRPQALRIRVGYVFHLNGTQQIDKTGRYSWDSRSERVVFQFGLKFITGTDASRIAPPRVLADYFHLVVRARPFLYPRHVCLLPASIQSEPVSRFAVAMKNSVITRCPEKRAVV